MNSQTEEFINKLLNEWAACEEPQSASFVEELEQKLLQKELETAKATAEAVSKENEQMLVEINKLSTELDEEYNNSLNLSRQLRSCLETMVSLQKKNAEDEIRWKKIDNLLNSVWN